MESIYKYFKFDKYSFENLDNLQIWCNYYENFNDPFECWCIEKTGIPDPEKEKERYDDIVMAWGYDPSSDNREEFFEYCSEFDNKYSMRVSDYVESARLSCFCKRNDNLLMWSHYANGLRGFCLEFDKEKMIQLNSFNAEVYDVMYQDVPPIFDTMLYEVAKDQVWYHEMAIGEEENIIQHIKDHVPDKLLPEYHIALTEARDLFFDLYSKMLCYKPLDWKYEEEVRLIYHTDPNDKIGKAYKFPKSAIKSIIFGERATKKDIKKLMKIVNRIELNIPAKIAERDKRKYRVNIISYGR